MISGIPPSVRICAVGRSGSGKTRWMHRHWIAHAPRVIIVDQTGEWATLEPNAEFCFGFTHTCQTLSALSRRTHWRCVAVLDNDELYRLIDVLIPIPNITASPSLALGGIAIYLDEVDLVVPRLAPTSARSLNRRSRHAGLSVLSATQRVSNVSKEITSMCDAIGILALHEPADQEYLRSLMGTEKLVTALQWAGRPFHVACYYPQTGRLELLPPENL